MWVGIVWQKPFKWKVYSVKTVDVYKYKLHKREMSERIDFWPTFYESIEINGDTGIITLKKEKNYAQFGYTEYKGRIYYGKTDYSPFTGNSWFEAHYSYTASKYLYKSYKEKDSYVKEVYSRLIETYPLNGIEGEYWYEFVR